MPMRTPASSSAQTGQVPEASVWLLLAQWEIVVPAPASRLISSALKWMPWASQTRSLSQPQSSR